MRDMRWQRLTILCGLLAIAGAETALATEVEIFTTSTSGESVTVRLEGWRTNYSAETGIYGNSSASGSASLALGRGDNGALYVALGSFDSGRAFARGGSMAGAQSSPPRGRRQELLDEYPFVWWVEVTPREVAFGKVGLEVRWERFESKSRGEAVRTAGGTRVVEMGEGEEHVLDLGHLPAGAEESHPPHDFMLKLTADVKEDPKLAGEMLSYELWHRHRENGSDVNDRGLRLLGKQGEEVGFRFAPLRFDPARAFQGDPSLVDVVLESVGRVKGRVRPDGLVDVRLDATRRIDTVPNGDPLSGGMGGGGEKIFTVASGEPVSLVLPPVHGSSAVSLTQDVARYTTGPPQEVDFDAVQIDYTELFAGHEDAIILTVTRAR